LTVSELNSIEDSFRNYISRERLNEDNMYDAGVHGKQIADRFIKFIKLPPVLQIVLTRMDVNKKTAASYKINQKFEICDKIDLDDLLEFDENSDRSDKNTYKLHSIIMHRGTAYAGHYFSFIKNCAKGNYWLEFNDNDVYLRDKKYILE